MEFGVVEFTKIAAYIVLFAFFWRTLATHLAQKDPGTTAGEVGKAMGFLF